jgi:hypothetical protein
MKNLLLTPLLLVVFLKTTSAAADFDKGMAAYEAEDYATALQEFKKDAAQGLAEAQNQLGQMYRLGYGVPLSYIEAIKWYALAAEQGLVEAEHSLGWIYDRPSSQGGNFVEAVKWYTLAAEQGYAQTSLGYMYVKGHGVEVNYSKADLLFKEDMENEEVRSLLNYTPWARLGIYTADNAFGYGLPLATLMILLHIFAKRRGWPAYIQFFTFLLCGGFIGLGLFSYIVLQGWLTNFLFISISVLMALFFLSRQQWLPALSMVVAAITWGIASWS